MGAHWFEAIIAAGALLIVAATAMVAICLEDLDSVASPPEFPDGSSDAPEDALAEEQERATGRARH